MKINYIKERGIIIKDSPLFLNNSLYISVENKHIVNIFNRLNIPHEISSKKENLEKWIKVWGLRKDSIHKGFSTMYSCKNNSIVKIFGKDSSLAILREIKLTIKQVKIK